MDNRKTLFIDIDGCILKHHNDTVDKILKSGHEILPGVLEKFHQWENESVYVVLTTARKESLREHTIAQLTDIGITYDVLLMGCGNGQRFVINDVGPKDSVLKAIGLNVERNKGLGDVELK